MSLANPKTISAVFRQHGISIAIGAPMMQIQELALAISLLDRYWVRATYEGLDHYFSVDIYRRHSERPIWCCTQTVSVDLPTEDSDEANRVIAIDDLKGIVEVLTELLQEDPQ